MGKKRNRKSEQGQLETIISEIVSTGVSTPPSQLLCCGIVFRVASRPLN